MLTTGLPRPPVRASRAYIASLGTTGVLVGSSILLLFVVSTLVAFRGWPGSGPGGDLGKLSLGDAGASARLAGPARPPQGPAGPARLAADLAPAAAAVGAPAGAPQASGAGGNAGIGPGAGGTLTP